MNNEVDLESGAQARKDIGKGLDGWVSQKYLQTKPCIRNFHISHNTLCLRVSCPSTHANSFECALSSSSLGTFNRPERNVNNAYAKLLASVGGQETRKQSGNVEMVNCPVTKLNTHPTHTPIPHTISPGNTLRIRGREFYGQRGTPDVLSFFFFTFIVTNR